MAGSHLLGLDTWSQLPPWPLPKVPQPPRLYHAPRSHYRRHLLYPHLVTPASYEALTQRTKPRSYHPRILPRVYWPDSGIWKHTPATRQVHRRHTPNGMCMPRFVLPRFINLTHLFMLATVYRVSTVVLLLNMLVTGHDKRTGSFCN
jgi:hypothetical protein